jgi:hypothetical protein
MSLRQEVIVYGDFAAPAGTVVANVVLTFTDGSGNHQGVTLAAGAQPAAIDLVAGDYTATAQAVDASGASIGPAATDTFSIAAPVTVTVSIPVSMSGTTA